MDENQAWWETVNWLDVLLTSGLLTTLLTIFLKWRADKKKAPLERAQVEAGIANENVASAMSISAEYREQLQVVKAAMQEDAERLRLRHEAEMESMRRNHDASLEALRTRLDSLETSNTELKAKVRRLEQDDQNSQQELGKQHRRIGNLEHKLTSARDTVLQLVNYIKEHQTGTGEIPTVDYTIFDV
jgi:chromosome segregation ATPase